MLGLFSRKEPESPESAGKKGEEEENMVAGLQKGNSCKVHRVVLNDNPPPTYMQEDQYA